VAKGRPKNFIPEADIRPLAAAFLKGEPIEGEIAIITRQQAEDADYNLSPSRWAGQTDSAEVGDIAALMIELGRLDRETHSIASALSTLLLPLYGDRADPAPLNLPAASVE
jgi:type I restriction enzyme M protein